MKVRKRVGSSIVGVWSSPMSKMLRLVSVCSEFRTQQALASLARCGFARG